MRAGFAVLPITPEAGLPMAGYGSRTEGALGVHDPLEARALWLENGKVRVALVALDLVGVDERLVDGARQRLADLLPAENLVVCATHTHAGPVVIRERIGSRNDQPGAEQVAPEIEARVERVVREAQAAARPARLGHGETHVAGLGANRRRPDGPFDPSVTVVRIEGTDGVPIAAIVRYACHPTVLDASNRFYSADYPGAARRQVQQSLDVPVLFVNGSAGDVSTRFTRREASFDEVERFGSLLAEAVVGVWPTIRASADGPLGLAADRVRPATRRLPSLAEAERGVAEAVADYERRQAAGAPAADVRVAETTLIGARRTLRLVRNGGLPSHLEAPLTALRLADLTLSMLPGEPFTRVAEEVRRKAGESVRVVGYAGGYVGYFLPAEEQDGYEAGAAVVSAEGVQTMIDAAARLAARVARQV